MVQKSNTEKTLYIIEKCKLTTLFELSFIFTPLSLEMAVIASGINNRIYISLLNLELINSHLSLC